MEAKDIDRYIGARVYALRLQKKLSRKTVAQPLGLTFQQIGKYEKGKDRISCGRLYLMAQTLGVHPGYFFHGLPDLAEETPPPDPEMLVLAEQLQGVAPPDTRKALELIIFQLTGEGKTPTLKKGIRKQK